MNHIPPVFRACFFKGLFSWLGGLGGSLAVEPSHTWWLKKSAHSDLNSKGFHNVSETSVFCWMVWFLFVLPLNEFDPKFVEFQKHLRSKDFYKTPWCKWLRIPKPVLTSLAHTVPWWKWMPKLICICWLLATTSRLGPGGFLLLGVPYTHYKDFLWKVGFPMVIWVVATQICFSVSIPKPWGFMIQFDVRIFFKWVGWNRPTSFWLA